MPTHRRPHRASSSREASPGVSRVGRGFTLIEPPVVIAIIALLIGILIPALGAARKAAQGLISQTNLRSLSLIHFLYHGENQARPYIPIDPFDLGIAILASDSMDGDGRETGRYGTPGPYPAFFWATRDGVRVRDFPR